MKRSLTFGVLLGLGATLAVLGIGVRDGPALAHIQNLAINPTGAILRPGGSQVSVSGTLSCTAGESGSLSVQVSQFVHGQVIVSAFGYSSGFTCSGIVQSWTVTALTFSVGLKPGPANVHVDLSSWGFDGFDSEHTSASVRLRSARELPPISPPVSPPVSPLAAALSGPAGVAAVSAVASVVMIGGAAGFLRLMGSGRRQEAPYGEE